MGRQKGTPRWAVQIFPSMTHWHSGCLFTIPRAICLSLKARNVPFHHSKLVILRAQIAIHVFRRLLCSLVSVMPLLGLQALERGAQLLRLSPRLCLDVSPTNMDKPHQGFLSSARVTNWCEWIQENVGNLPRNDLTFEVGPQAHGTLLAEAQLTHISRRQESEQTAAQTKTIKRTTPRETQSSAEK